MADNYDALERNFQRTEKLNRLQRLFQENCSAMPCQKRGEIEQELRELGSERKRLRAEYCKDKGIKIIELI